MKPRLPAVLVIVIVANFGGLPLAASPITSTITSDAELDANTPVHIINGTGIQNFENSSDPLNIAIRGPSAINVSGTTEEIRGIAQIRSSTPFTVKGMDDHAFLQITLTPGTGDAIGIYGERPSGLMDIDVKTSVTINDGGAPISNAIGMWILRTPITFHQATAVSVTAHGILGRLWGISITEPGYIGKFEDDLRVTVTGTLNEYGFYASGINADYGGVVELNGTTHVTVTEDGAGNSGTFLGISSAFDDSLININGPIDITVSSNSPDRIGGMLAQGGRINSIDQTKITTLPGALAIEATTDEAVPGIVHISRHANVDEMTKAEAVPGSITGDISVDDSMSIVHVNISGKLDDGSISFYQGATRNAGGTFNLGLHDGAEWRVMDEPDANGIVTSPATNLAVSDRGVIDLATYAGQGNPDHLFRTLSLEDTHVSITGNMVLRVNTDLARGASDKLIFAEGYDASGQTVCVEIIHDSSLHKIGDKIQVPSGQEVEIVRNFTGGTVKAEGNAYFYDASLQQGWLEINMTPDGKIQEAELLTKPPSPVDPEIPPVDPEQPPVDPNPPPVSTPVATASDDVAALRGLVFFTLPEMTRHLNDLQALDRSMRKNSFWYLAWGGQANADSIAHVSRGFDQNLYGFQLGSDFVVGKGEGVVGGLIEHSQADNSYSRGSGKIKGNGFGAYASWMPGRSYINLAAKVQHLDSEYDSTNLQNLSVSGDYRTWAYMVVLEAGHRFMLPGSPLWLEPQAGFTLTHIEGFSYVNSQNTRIHSSGINSALARAGLGLGWNVTGNTSLHVKASVLRDMGGNGRLFASADGNGITVPMYDMTNTWGEFTLGFHTNFSDSLQLFSNITSMTGGNYHLDWTIAVGMRYLF